MTSPRDTAYSEGWGEAFDSSGYVGPSQDADRAERLAEAIAADRGASLFPSSGYVGLSQAQDRAERLTEAIAAAGPWVMPPPRPPVSPVRRVAAAAAAAAAAAIAGVLPGVQLDDIPFVGANMQPGADLRDVSATSVDGMGLSDLAGGAATAVTLAGLGQRLGLHPALIAAIAAAGGGAAVLFWDDMPGWLQAALAAAGVAVGTGIALKGAGSLAGRLSRGAGPGDQMPGGDTVVSSWVANGTTFYRLADGRLAVQNKHGVWKRWRPRKGTLVFANGSSTLAGFLRADKALNKQSKKIEKVLNRRTRPRTKPRV